MTWQFIVSNLILTLIAGMGMAYICFRIFVKRFLLTIALAYQQDMEAILLQIKIDFLEELKAMVEATK